MAWCAIEPGTGMLAIGCAESEHHLAKMIPGCNFSEKDKLWRVPLSWPAYVCLRTAWGSWPLDVVPGLAAWAASAWNDVRIAYELRSAMDAVKTDTGGEIISIEMDQPNGLDGKVLFPFQRGGVQWLVTQKRAVLGDPQGNGKTPQIIRAIQVLRARDTSTGAGERPVLVIARGAALYSWRDEFAAWAPELTVRVVTGTALKRRKILEEKPLADVYIMAWPTVRMHTRLAHYAGTRFVRCAEHGGTDAITVGRCEVHPKELNAINWLAVVPDEAHAMRDAKSKQSRAVSWLAQHAEYFWPVTGTPVADTIEDVWPLGHGIDPAGFPAKSRFLDLFAIKDFAWHKGADVLGLRPDNAAAFQAIVQPLIRRIPKELARPGMPPRLPPVFRYPEMEPGQARMYRQIAKEFLADIGPGTVIVPENTAVRFGRLCQLAATSLKAVDGEDSQGFSKDSYEPVLPSPKIDDLTEFLGDNPGPLVVSANSPRVIALAERKLDEAKITHCKLVGGMSDEEKYTAVRWFQDGQCRVILLTPGTGGESITLTASDTVFFLQPNPSFLATQQVIGRVDRIGQASPVRVVYSVTPGTVERRLYQLGQSKEERAGQVTRDPDLLRWILTDDKDDDHDAEQPGSEQEQLRLI